MADQKSTYATSSVAEKMAWYKPSSLSGADADSRFAVSAQGLGLGPLAAPSHADPTLLDSSFVPTSNEQLRLEIMDQINYYFSPDNLVKDEFLRLHMDTNGWVPIQLIASFAKVARLTKDIHLIVDVLMSSEVVEVEGSNVRCKHGWQRWVYKIDHISRIVSSRSIPPSLVARLNDVRL